MDQRLTGSCVYCGAAPETVDHVPAKAFLDEPYPADLAVVDSCVACNNGCSRDEAYLACLLECALMGSLEAAAASRATVARRLQAHPGLSAALSQARFAAEDGAVSWRPDVARVEHVLVKLAMGHIAYDLGFPHLGPPERIAYAPLVAIPEPERVAFESPPAEFLLPELGSRAFIRTVVTNGSLCLDQGWEVVQPGNYRYLASHSERLLVRVVIREYLAGEVAWPRHTAA